MMLTSPSRPFVTGAGAATATGLSYRMVDYYVRRGYVDPTIPAAGSGTHRGFSLDDCVALAAIGHIPFALDDADIAALVESVRRGDPKWTTGGDIVETAVDLDRLRDEVSGRWPNARRRSRRRTTERKVLG